ncbi:MAG TPA: TetR/AcrR family transcriptional regulator [Solirubrobacterales bacterium]|nr:TetR/AcrR family transcriptional regulator [Solirubrobacterales bacterium]
MAPQTRRASSSRGARTRSARYPKLKPGPGRTADEVGAHQRARLQKAMVELVAARGYNAVSVATLSGRAGVSKRDFYKHFESKEECFLATYDLIVNNSVGGILAAAEGEVEWRERLRLGFLALAEQIAERPAAARLALVEVFAAGAPAVDRVLDTNRRFEALVARDLALADGHPDLPRLVVKGIVAGGGRVARARLLSGHPGQLILDGDELMEWVLSLCDAEVVRLPGLGAGAPAPTASAAELPLDDERALILAATARLASRDGYSTLTVARIRAAAGVSKQSFDAHFDGVEDCFLATLEVLSGRTMANAAPHYFDAADWASGVHRMIVSLCHHLAADPTFVKLAFLEVFSPRREAIQWRSEMIARLAARLRREAPPEWQPSEFAAEASVGAMWGLIHYFVATGRNAQLPLAAPVLSYLALAPALGGAMAIEVIDRNHFA